MFTIEALASLVMVLLVPGEKGMAIIYTPLLAGGAAAIAGLMIGLYEKQLIAKERTASGPVVTGAKLQPKKKRKEKAEEKPAAAPATVPIRAIGDAPQPQPSPSVSTEAPATPPAAASAHPVSGMTSPPRTTAPQVAPAAQPPAAPATPRSVEERSPSIADDKLPAWMEKAMQQARLSQESPAEATASQEELRARLEQPVDLGMPVKTPTRETSGAASLEEIDSLVGSGAGASGAGDQLESLISSSAAGAPSQKPPSTASGIRAAIFHTDLDQRRHIASMLAGIGISIAFEADSEEDALLQLLNENVDVIVTSPDVASRTPAEFLKKLRKASQFALIVGYGDGGFEGSKEIAVSWTPGSPVPGELARMLGL